MTYYVAILDGKTLAWGPTKSQARKACEDLSLSGIDRRRVVIEERTLNRSPKIIPKEGSMATDTLTQMITQYCKDVDRITKTFMDNYTDEIVGLDIKPVTQQIEVVQKELKTLRSLLQSHSKTALYDAVANLAKKRPDLRVHLVPLLKKADEFPVNEIDHGYDAPLAGSTDVMQKLQNELLKEQGRKPRPGNHQI